jgi:hypothetical protein
MHENKKICKGCGRNRKLGKFGKLSSSPDGKNIYCRDCMRAFRRRYNETPKGKMILQKCIQTWKDNNKEHIKDYNKQYYLKNKERILYNKRAREETECILITEKPKKTNKRKINKDRDICTIKINPTRKKGNV